jgi:hypothetical protein
MQAEAGQGFRTEAGKTAIDLAVDNEVRRVLQNQDEAIRRAAEIDIQMGLRPEGLKEGSNVVRVAPAQNQNNSAAPENGS